MTLQRGFKTAGERKAGDLRSALGLHAKVPLYAKMLAQHMGVPIVTPQQIKGLAEEDLNQLCGHGASNWSALTLITPEITFIIHNPSHTDGRQESNIMHELSHLICDHKPSEIIQLDGFSFPIRTCAKHQEEEADWICGCLKLPRDGMLWALGNGMSHEAIAKYFVASLELVRYRIRITGVDKQLQRMKQRWKR